MIIKRLVYKYRSSSYCEHCAFPDLGGQKGSYVHEDSKKGLTHHTLAQTIRKRCIRNAFYYESFSTHCTISLHFKTCTKCVLQSVQNSDA